MKKGPSDSVRNISSANSKNPTVLQKNSPHPFLLCCFLEIYFMFKNIKTSPSLLFWQDIYWGSRFKENLWSVWKFGLLCTFSILFCPTFKIQKLEWNLLETKSSFNCFNPKVHPRNNQGDRARVNLITTKGAPSKKCFWTNSWRKICYLFILRTRHWIFESFS